VKLNSYALSLVSLRDPDGPHLVALMCFLGMLFGLFGEFVGSQMIRFVGTSSIMNVFRKIVNFSRSIMRALWHGLPPGM
jgi:xanthosine utilization system XapX-like protein